MRIINLAHGSLAVIAAYALFWLADSFAVSPFLGLIVVLPVMAAIGWGLQKTVIERCARSGLLVPVLSTFGLSIVVDNLLFQAFGADTRSLAPFVGTLSYDSSTSTTTSRSQPRDPHIRDCGRDVRGCNCCFLAPCSGAPSALPPRILIRSVSSGSTQRA